MRIASQRRYAVSYTLYCACATPAARDAPAGRHLLVTHPHIDDSRSRPPLGTYPNFHAVEGMPSQVDAPETNLHVSHDFHVRPVPQDVLASCLQYTDLVAWCAVWHAKLVTIMHKADDVVRLIDDTVNNHRIRSYQHMSGSNFADWWRTSFLLLAVHCPMCSRQ